MLHSLAKPITPRSRKCIQPAQHHRVKQDTVGTPGIRNVWTLTSRIGHLVPIQQPLIRSPFHLCCKEPSTTQSTVSQAKAKRLRARERCIPANDDN
jgi:hypothetical protein